jgi:hypothetical protein
MIKDITELDGEWFNNKLKTLLPEGKLSKFERNFIAYKLAEEINGSYLKQLIKNSKVW